MIDERGNVKLIDFGFAKILRPENSFRTATHCGTLGYTAPEVLIGQSSGYSFECDIWSYGILLCELFSSSLPFEDERTPQAIQD